jgi:hypothetical protein
MQQDRNARMDDLRQWDADDDIFKFQVISFQFIFHVHITRAIAGRGWPAIYYTDRISMW